MMSMGIDETKKASKVVNNSKRPVDYIQDFGIGEADMDPEFYQDLEMQHVYEQQFKNNRR